MVEPAILGPIDVLLAPMMEYVVLVLVLANLVTRFIAHRQHVRQAAAGGPEAVQRHRLHEFSNVVLVLASFYYLTLHHHSGMVLSVLVVGTVLTDFFEFEARRVEARRELPLDQPKGAIVASSVVLLYAAYLSLFFVIEPVWSAVI